MLTQKQLTSVTVTGIVIKMLVAFPTMIFRLCANAAWLAGIYVTLVAIGVFVLLRSIYTEKENIITLAEKAGGTVTRVIVGAAVFITLAINTIGLMREFPEITKLVLLQKTYIEIIGTAFAIALFICASCGIEGIVRVIEIFIPIVAIIFVGFLLMIVPQIHIDYLMPILGNGTKAIFVDGLSALSIFTDLLALNILLPRTDSLSSYKNAGTHAIIIGGICAVLIFLAYGLCYIYPVSGQFVIPIYQMERLINLSDFFSRLESLFRFVWSIMILLYASFYIAVLSEVWAQTFRLPHSKPLIAPIIITLIGIAIIPESLGDMITLEAQIHKWIYIPALLIPIIVAGIYKMFHVKQRERK